MELSQLYALCLRVPYSRVGQNANYALRRQGETLYIFFEDSEGLRDWQRNLEFSARPYGEYLVHRGFLSVWQDLEPILALPIADRSVGKILIAGYSHGGALAALCHEYAWRIRPDLQDTLEGYGFGSPRVIRGRKGESLRPWEHFTVVRNRGDLVTHLPPASFGYTHVGSMLQIGRLGKYSPIEAHYSENYLKELKVWEAQGAK